MRIVILISLFFFNLSPTLSLAAENYTVGRQSCDFQAAEDWYQDHPTDMALYAIGLYGSCLVIKGIATNDPAMRNQGLGILERHTGNSGFNDVDAMYFLAEYFKTNGKFDGTTDEDNIDMAIRAYDRTLLFIQVDPEYPSKYWTSEQEDQMEIFSFYMIPELYSYRYEYGWIGSHNRYLNESPSYTGDKRDLNLYLDHSRDPTALDHPYSELPVIKDSINQMISSADACINLPFKYYHRQEIYNYYQKRCNILRLAGLALLPLEIDRQGFLFYESCKKDVLQCEGYMEVYNEMDSLLQEAIKQLANQPNPW